MLFRSAVGLRPDALSKLRTVSLPALLAYSGTSSCRLMVTFLPGRKRRSCGHLCIGASLLSGFLTQFNDSHFKLCNLLWVGPPNHRRIRGHTPHTLAPADLVPNIEGQTEDPEFHYCFSFLSGHLDVSSIPAITQTPIDQANRDE